MAIFDNITLLFKQGLKIDLPASGPKGEAFYCTDTKELFIGTGSGIALAVCDSVTAEAFSTAAVAAEAALRAAGDTAAISTAETYADSGDATEASARASAVTAAISTSEAYTDSAVTAEATARAAAVTAEASARASADTSEAATRAAADTSEATARAAADTSEATARASGDTAAISTAEAYTDSAVTTEATARASADSSEATTRASADALRELLANKDTDGTLAANSDTKYASQKATKTYVDAETTRATAAEALRVPKTTTVNGHALSADVVVSASDLTTGTLPHAQLPTLLLADLPVVNAQRLGGFFSNGRINIHGGEASGLPGNAAMVAPADTVFALQFTLVAPFKVSRVSFETVFAAGATALTLSSVANASGGSTVYTGTITGGTSNHFAGYTFVITGFVNGVNNGTFYCTASSTTTLTLSNASGTAETHAGTATPQSKFALALYDSGKNLLCQSGEMDGTNVSTSQSATFAEVTLPPGVYYIAQWANNIDLKMLAFLPNNDRLLFGTLAASGYIRNGNSSNSFSRSTGFPSSLGTLDGIANPATPVCLWEMA